MPNESSAAQIAEAAATTHGAELSADEVAQRLGDLGTDGKPEAQGPEGDAKPDGAEAESTEQAEAGGEQEQQAEDAGADGAPAEEAEDRIPKARLDHEIEKRRKATEAREAAERERDALKQQIDAQAGEVAERMALDPSYLSPEDRKLILRTNELEAEIAQLAEHPEGVEDDDPKKAMSAAQVSRRLNAAQVELSRIGGRADSAYRTAKQQQNADLALGRKIRLEQEAALKLKQAPKKPDGKPVAAAAPAKAAASTARPIGTPGLKRPDISKIFKDGGGTAQAAEAALAAM